ncbi:MAG: GNAT family N-acetyltransferase [Paraglaciecola sp.]|uniref:GNAT family N-acetyltransferase n=1 Tax=Paraglaciecola sp. TaxID=1920173 RepID=UPI0032994E85
MYTKTFEQLTKDELYALAKLRQEVFIVEQNSIYLDLDDCDQEAVHFLEFGTQNRLMAYGRYRKILEAEEVKIERVVLTDQARGQGLGKFLIVAMLKEIQEKHPSDKITLSSQIAASEFYRRLGFVEYGEQYDDGGIMHIGMVYRLE